MRILVVVPAYNESDSIGRVIGRLTDWAKGSDLSLDYVIVNDGSSDNTREVIEKLALSAIHLPVNLGIGGAVQTGFLYAEQEGYDIAIQMDGDGQHPPEYIGDLVDPILNGKADMVIGSRFLTGEGFQTSSMRRFGIRWLCLAIRMAAGKTVTDATSGFRAVNQRGIRLFSKQYAKDYPEPEGIVQAVKNGLRVMEVPVKMEAREAGESSIKTFSSIYYMIKVTLAILIRGMEKAIDPVKEDRA